MHYLQPGGRALIEEHLPAVFGSCRPSVPCRFNPAAAAARCLPDGAGKDLELSRFETLTTCRRPLIDFAFATAASKTPGVEIRHGCSGYGPRHGHRGDPGRAACHWCAHRVG